jgi:hypothetical protein
MNRMLAYALAALLVLSACLSFGLWRSVSANGALKAERDTAVQALARAVDSRKKTEAVLATVRVEKAAQARKSVALEKALSEAYSASPEWSGTRTPPAVQEALQGAVEGLE